MEAGPLEIILRAKSPVLFSKLRRISLSVKSGGDVPKSRSGVCNIGPEAAWHDGQIEIIKIKNQVQNVVAKIPTALVVSSNFFVLEVLCEEANWKSAKKQVKGERKQLGVRVDKEANEYAERDLIREAVDCCISVGLQKNGWNQIASRRFLSSGLSAEVDEPVSLLSVRTDLDGDDQIHFHINLDSVRLKRFPMVEAIPRVLQEEFHQGKEVSWLDSDDEFPVENMRCVVLPSLEEGLVVGCGYNSVQGLSSKELAETWAVKFGLSVPQRSTWISVLISSEDESRVHIFPDCCVLTAASPMPVPISLRKSSSRSALKRLYADLQKCDLFKCGMLKLKALEDVAGALGCQPSKKSGSKPAQFAETCDWTSAATLKASDLPSESHSSVVTNLKPITTSAAAYRPKPPLPVAVPRKSPPRDNASLNFRLAEGFSTGSRVLLNQRNDDIFPVAQCPSRPTIIPRFSRRTGADPPKGVKRNTGKQNKESAASVSSMSEAASSVSILKVSEAPASGTSAPVRAVMLPSFVRKKPKDSTNQSGGASKKAPGKSAAKPRGEKAEKASAQTKKRKKPAGDGSQAPSQGPIGDISKISKDGHPAKLAKLSETDLSSSTPVPATASEKNHEVGDAAFVTRPPEEKAATKKPTTAATIDADENSLLVAAMVKADTLKNLPLPQLKKYITTHKLGKVSGKKEELLQRIMASFGK